MKPIKLLLSAFGPYKEYIEIDFTKLGEKGIFLITGDTGAGKTTIFDAISFALFGKVSGSNRPITSIRSDFAKPEDDTFVELEFIHKNKKYKLRRNPSYVRPKLRGEGTTQKVADAYLEYDENIISGIKNVDEKIQEILGVNEKQFKQIAMLAQGEFLKVLFAESKDRTEIFRKIFNTDIYNKISKRLKESLKTKYEELQKTKYEFLTNSKNIIWNKKIDILPKDLNISYAIEVVTQLEEELKENKKSYKCTSNNIKRMENELNDINEKIKIQEEINIKIDEKEKLLLEKDEYKMQKIKYENLRMRIEQNQRIKEKLKPLENILQNQNIEINNLENDIQNISKKIEYNKQKEKEFSEKLVKIDKIENLINKYNENNQKLEEYKNKEILIKSLKNLIKEKEFEAKKYNQKENDYRKLNIEYLKKEDEFFREQAGILAERLEENKPCPVCGSLEHPSIASKSNTVLSKEELENFKKAIKEKQKEKEITQTNCIKIKTKIEATLVELDLKIENIDKLSQNVEEAINLNEKDLKNGKKELENIYKDITGDKLELEKFNFNEFKTSELEKINSYKNEIIKIKTICKEKNTYLQEMVCKRKANKTKYKKALEELGFNNENEYRTIILEEKALAEAKAEVEEYYENITVNQVKISELDKSIHNMKKQDVQEEKERALLLKENLNNEKKKQVQVKSILDNNLRIYEILNKKKKELEKAINIYLKYDTLSKTANGTLQGKRKIEFEQYVQAVYFDMVILEANKRLSQMTESRYWLLRKENPEKLSDKVGLELEVIDNYTGKKRSVKSLSGGEAFKAALSLALGLSDIIQSYSGGVVVDTLFIDEGFGSLDTESREKAINTLNLLINGNKLIGIISHVSELKEKIDKKIIVVKTNEGSKVKIEA